MIRYLLTLFFLCFILFATKAQTYTIPWATQQPAWVFPLWFEDGAGQKDTLYYCYDPSAHYSPNDYNFGEGYKRIDTSKFFAFFSSPRHNDSVQKANCYDSSFLYTYDGAMHIGLSRQKGNYVKMSWDVSLFRNAILPFPNLSPAPKIQGFVWYEPGFPFSVPKPDGKISFCHYEAPIPISDSFISTPISCVAKDSIIFPNSCKPVDFYIKPWTGKNEVGISTINTTDKIDIYPNPCIDILTINFFATIPSTQNIEVFSIAGKKVKQIINQNQLDVSDLSNGVYILKITNPQNNITKHFVKQ